MSSEPKNPLVATVTTVAASTASLATRVLDWLRAGYPEGVPGADRVPLLALLRSTPLTDDEVREVVREFAKQSPLAGTPDGITEEQIEDMIREVTNRDVDAEDVQRVAAKLAAKGWPIDAVLDQP